MKETDENRVRDKEAGRHRQTYIQKGRQTGTQTYRQADRQIG